MMTIDARLELFKQQFPHQKITSVQEREGTDHSVLEINHTWMCKSSKTQEGIARLAREAQLLELLQGKITATIPVPLYYTENFLVYKKIPGSPLIAYSFYRFSSKRRSLLAFEVAQFLVELHKVLTPEEISFLGVTKSEWPWSWEKLQDHRHLVAENKDLAELFDNVLEVYKAELVEQVEPTLIFDDMNIRNIIVDSLTGQLRGIIDFADVALGDPQLDLRLRRENPVDFSRAVAFVYAMMHNTQPDPQKMYAYYFATEFSRYFDFLEKGNSKEAQATLHGIIGSIRDFLKSHDSCKDGQPCMHNPAQTEVSSQASV